MFVDDRGASPARQLSLIEDAVAVAEHGCGPGADYGEVFTRRWVVDLILDLVGYAPERDLGAQVLVEPSCGTGAFLVPVVERLIASSQSFGRDLATLGPAVRAFDLLGANVERARKAVGDLLTSHGLTDPEAEHLAEQWVGAGDFLLQAHEPSSADYVVGNPPYIRLEGLPREVMEAYRRTCTTMRGRSDIYVGFFERGLELLKPDGALSFICADRWMRNQYGAHLRELITRSYAVDAVISMHDADAFDDDVAAYPAVVLLRNRPQGKVVVVEADETFGAADARQLTTRVQSGRRSAVVSRAFEATRVDGWFSGRDLWPAGSPSQLALIADLESRFPPLQDISTGTRVGIGVATGCDDVFITGRSDLVEADRLLPLLRAPDTAGGSVDWSGRYLVNPWDGDGLVDLARHPRLATYLNTHADRLRARHVARRCPDAWFRTIDRVDRRLIDRPKLVMPDMKAAAHPVIDEGRYYPHHNLYYVMSDAWDLEVLGGILLSDIANLFVGAYCVRMRGGTYRFQAQYLRRIRVPPLASVGRQPARRLAAAFAARDREMATAAAAQLYGVDPAVLRTARPVVS